MLTRDKSIPELYLRQPGFTYSACGTLTKHCKWIEKFRQGDNLKIYIGIR